MKAFLNLIKSKLKVLQNSSYKEELDFTDSRVESKDETKASQSKNKFKIRRIKESCQKAINKHRVNASNAILDSEENNKGFYQKSNLHERVQSIKITSEDKERLLGINPRRMRKSDTALNEVVSNIEIPYCRSYNLQSNSPSKPRSFIFGHKTDEQKSSPRISQLFKPAIPKLNEIQKLSLPNLHKQIN